MGTVIRKTAFVMELIAKREPCSLKYLTEATKLKKPALYLMLKSLTEAGFLDKSPDRQYSIGRKLYNLVETRKSYSKLIACSQNAAQELSEKIHESVTIAVIDDMLYKRLYHKNCTLPVQLNSDIAERLSFYQSATGRVLLSAIPFNDLKNIVVKHGLPTENEWSGINSFEKLKSELETIRSSGVCHVDNQQFSAFYIAVPARSIVTDSTVAIGVDIPIFRASDEYIREIHEKMSTAARSLKAMLSM